jgi:transposase
MPIPVSDASTTASARQVRSSRRRAGRIAAASSSTSPSSNAPIALEAVSSEFESFLREKRALLSSKSEIAKAVDYMLKRWPAFTRFLDDGRICLTNNAAERALRGIALGRHNWTFAGSDEGGRRAAAMYTLIETAKLNDVDFKPGSPIYYDASLAEHPAKRLHELLPWNWKAQPPPE